jgi:hypothetical protein
MKTHRSICLASAALFLAIAGTTIKAEESAHLTGTWKWVAPANPDGQIPAITFTLKSQGEAVTGTVNKTAGTETITNGVVKSDEVTFQTIRQKKAGQTTTTFTGKISGDKIKGTIEIDAGGRIFGPQDWEADRVKQ